MTKPISQREARRLRKQVTALTQIESWRYRTWNADYPGGVHLCSLPYNTERVHGTLVTAQRLGFVLIVRATDDGLRFFAVKP